MDVVPRACAEQEQRRRRWKHVVVEFERRRSKETHDGERPGPEERFERIESLTAEHRAAIVNEAADEQSGPWQESGSKNLKVEPPPRLIGEPARCKQPEGLVQHVSVDE